MARKKRFFLRLAAACVLLPGIVLAALCIITPNPLPALYARPVSPVLLDDAGGLIHARLSAAGEWSLPIPFADMGQWLPRILVAVEDKRFYSHPGIDPLALGRAFVQNALSGKVLSGASTISSQLVRLAHPRPRTVQAKVYEFVGALKLEWHLSKQQILELYLNNAPFGGPIRGVEAAARLYFDKKAAELSLGEAALLIGMLKGPTAYRPDKNPAAALKRRQQIIRQAAHDTGFAPELTALALEEPLPAYKPAMPNTARHFADLAFAFLPPQGGAFASSLNTTVQKKLERALREALAQAGPDVTAAGIVVNNRNASVIAYVGNALLDTAKGKHWVDCAISPRSPGSTLKPFVYAMAMDKGHIIPASLLADTPLQLSGEAPRNFDRRYRGPVSARTALADSLNAPAVRVLRLLGVENTLAALRSGGFSFLNRPDADYGDSLVLGAGEVTLLELARAYSALARNGENRPLVLSVPNEQRSGLPYLALAPYSAAPAKLWCEPPSGLAAEPEQRAGKSPRAGSGCSPAAAWLVTDILRDTGRLPFLYQINQGREMPPPAFKTGTSFGLRDAWTAAYSPSFTVVVWFGKEKGGADPRLVGISLAAPVAVNLLREMDPEPAWPQPPPECGTVTVCALSGAAPSPACPALKNAMNVASAWRTKPCTLHTMRAGKSRLEWPTDLEDFTRMRFAKDDLSRPVLIVSPMPGARYLITPGVRLMPLPLKAEGVAYPVYWYADGLYLGKQEKEETPLYWQPEPGQHTISFLDAKERDSSLQVTVTDLSAE